MSYTAAKIKSNEGKEFELTLDSAKLMVNMQSKFEELNGEAWESKKYDTWTIMKVVLYCKHYTEKEPMKKIEMTAMRSLEMKDNVQKWYADFIDNCDQNQVVKLMNAANDLGIATLMTLTSMKMAGNMRKMPKEDYQKFVQYAYQQMAMAMNAAGAGPGAGAGKF